ncbi:MAG: GNAT family N-acetyltransferase [Patescibacteria group bacterium]|jgi:GNAT superfamily N-acetyltransferase
MSEMERNRLEREWSSPEVWFDENLENPERPERSVLENLNEGEGTKLIELLEAKVAEVEPGPLKNRYRQLLQEALRGLGDRRLIGDSGKTKPFIQEEYRLRLSGKNLALQARANEISNYSDAISIDNAISATTIDYEKSIAHLVNIGSENHHCFINLKIFNLVLKDGSRKKYLYIADRYVAPPLQGQGAGKQLLLIAERVAKDNACSLIFSRLVPEDPTDLGRLVASTEKLGYQTREDSGFVLSTKKVED